VSIDVRVAQVRRERGAMRLGGDHDPDLPVQRTLTLVDPEQPAIPPVLGFGVDERIASRPLRRPPLLFAVHAAARGGDHDVDASDMRTSCRWRSISLGDISCTVGVV
jgi:hypothetical protein